MQHSWCRRKDGQMFDVTEEYANWAGNEIPQSFQQVSFYFLQSHTLVTISFVWRIFKSPTNYTLINHLIGWRVFFLSLFYHSNVSQKQLCLASNRKAKEGKAFVNCDFFILLNKQTCYWKSRVRVYKSLTLLTRVVCFNNRSNLFNQVAMGEGKIQYNSQVSLNIL